MDWKKKIFYKSDFEIATCVAADFWPTTRLMSALFLVDKCFLRLLAGEKYPDFGQIIGVIQRQEKLFHQHQRRMMAELQKQLGYYSMGILEADEDYIETVPGSIFRLSLSLISRIRLAQNHLGYSEFSEVYLKSLLWDALPDLWSEIGRPKLYARTWLDERRGCLASGVRGRFEETGELPRHAVKHLAACIDCRISWKDEDEIQRFFDTLKDALRRAVMENEACPSIKLIKDVWHLQASSPEIRIVRKHMKSCKRCQFVFQAYEKRVYLKNRRDLE